MFETIFSLCYYNHRVNVSWRTDMVNVVLGIVQKEQKILLVKRERGDFVGLWAIPGGKVEECEHLDEAVKREMLEEVGLEMKFEKLLGISTEIMHDKNSTSLIYICLLKMNENDIIKNPEFEYKWFTKNEIIKSKNIIESDKRFIEEFYINRKENYLKMDCYRNENGEYFWK